jgi:hypothetical protein
VLTVSSAPPHRPPCEKSEQKKRKYNLHQIKGFYFFEKGNICFSTPRHSLRKIPLSSFPGRSSQTEIKMKKNLVVALLRLRDTHNSEGQAGGGQRASEAGGGGGGGERG